MLNTKEVFPGFLRFSVRFGDCNTLCHLPSRAQVPPLTKENASTLQTCISSCMLFFGPVKSPKYGAVSFSGSYASAAWRNRTAHVRSQDYADWIRYETDIRDQYGCFLKWWYPQNTHPKCWSFLVGPKARVVGETPTILGKPYIFVEKREGGPWVVRVAVEQFVVAIGCHDFHLQKVTFLNVSHGEFLSASPGVHPEMAWPKAYLFFWQLI